MLLLQSDAGKGFPVPLRAFASIHTPRPKQVFLPELGSCASCLLLVPSSLPTDFLLPSNLFHRDCCCCSGNLAKALSNCSALSLEASVKKAWWSFKAFWVRGSLLLFCSSSSSSSSFGSSSSPSCSTCSSFLPLLEAVFCRLVAGLFCEAGLFMALLPLATWVWAWILPIEAHHRIIFCLGLSSLLFEKHYLVWAVQPIWFEFEKYRNKKKTNKIQK